MDGGDGLLRHEGLSVFVPRSAPGDVLRIQIIEQKKNFARGVILEILEPGPSRRNPPCAYFQDCGGCDLQHIEDEAQLILKAEAARETLSRIAGLELKDPLPVTTGGFWGYRLRTKVHFRPDAEGLPTIGFLARNSDQHVPVDACPILAPSLEGLLTTLPEKLASTYPQEATLATGGDGRVSVSPAIGGLPTAPIVHQVLQDRITFDSRCFFQPHRNLLVNLVELAVGDFEGNTAYDLYCGVGLFALALARKYKRVIGVESDRVATSFAQQNAKANQHKNLTINSSRVESWIRRLPHSADRVLLDPPRTGMSSAVRTTLLSKRPDRITYVSCHVATLARDLAHFLPAYDLESLHHLDLFPQTGHLETVAQLIARP